MRGSLPLTLQTIPQIPMDLCWMLHFDRICGLCIYEAVVTEITELCDIAHYPKEFTGAWKVHIQLSAHCYWSIMDVNFHELSWKFIVHAILHIHKFYDDLELCFIDNTD